ncbi:hypothetical protein JMW73_00740 (plasmid) [Klebsiella pneumoniae]|nr:hypothetical protein JMW73_00740 [Klebsiella pneumoniae]UZI60313.1 hypothetical protein JMV94_00920 [Klebsiella pneumoniae]UZI75195.1 hypothetical protein JMW76_25865 [Klebsiella pneumoniae]
MTVFLILTAIAYGIFKTGCFILLVVKGYQGWTLFWKNYDRLPHIIRLKWFTEFGHLNRGDMLTSEQHRCHNEKKKFQRRV